MTAPHTETLTHQLKKTVVRLKLLKPCSQVNTPRNISKAFFPHRFNTCYLHKKQEYSKVIIKHFRMPDDHSVKV